MLLFTLLLRNLGPGVPQGDDPVEHKLVLGGINRIHAEIPVPLKLVSAARGCLSPE